jgi:mxaK protein
MSTLRLAARRAAGLSLLLAALLLGAIAWDAFKLLRSERTNARVTSATAQKLTPQDPLEVVFAQALRLGEGDSAEQVRLAHDLYARVALNAKSELALAAEYNHANLLLREALRLKEQEQDAQAAPLIELAKEAYRKVLRERADAWDVRYNLERALRLAPEPADPEEGEAPVPEQRERAATTMRGFSMGLP